MVFRISLFLLSLLALAGCLKDETIAGYVDRSADYRLVSLNGAPFEVEASIHFKTRNRVQGSGPCNRFSGLYKRPYPWVEFGPISITRRACPELDAEQAFIVAFSAVTFAEVSGPVLLLTGEGGEELVFQSDR